jgi:hypothetical protein
MLWFSFSQLDSGLLSQSTCTWNDELTHANGSLLLLHKRPFGEYPGNVRFDGSVKGNRHLCGLRVALAADLKRAGPLFSHEGEPMARIALGRPFRAVRFGASNPGRGPGLPWGAPLGLGNFPSPARGPAPATFGGRARRVVLEYRAVARRSMQRGPLETARGISEPGARARAGYLLRSTATANARCRCTGSRSLSSRRG